MPSETFLPVAETEGVASGAVQPPGSKGDDIVHTRTCLQDPGDEPDATTTFTGEDDTGELNATGDLTGGVASAMAPIRHRWASALEHLEQLSF